MWLTVIITLFIALLVWQFIASRKAVATTVVESSLSPQQAAQAVEGAFGGARSMLWTGARGPGMINKRRRGRDRGVTMSINIQPGPSGGSELSLWASQYSEYFSTFANVAGSVNSRKRAIARLVG